MINSLDSKLNEIIDNDIFKLLDRNIFYVNMDLYIELRERFYDNLITELKTDFQDIINN